MSMLSIYQTKAGKLRGDIASLNKKLSVEKAAQARKSKEANSTASCINNTFASSLKTKLSKRQGGQEAPIGVSTPNTESRRADSNR